MLWTEVSSPAGRPSWAAGLDKRPSAPAACFDWRATLAALEGAYADNTLKAYRSDFAIFEAWCEAAGERSLPATPETLARFVAADAKAGASATLRRRLYAIRKIHRLLGLPNAVDAEAVNTAMRRALRGKLRRPVQALALTAELRDQLIGACPDSLIGLRDQAMLATGYDTLCRRGELVGLMVEDVQPVRGGGARVLVRRSKSDPFGDGRWAHVSARGYRRLQAWLAAAGIASGVIFRSVRGARVGAGPLDPIAVNRLVKGRAGRAGLAPEVVRGLSGHSMRVGAAQDLMRQGRDVTQIMLAGGWQSVAVVRGYLREAVFDVWAD